MLSSTVYKDLNGVAITAKPTDSELAVEDDFQKKSYTLYRNSGTKGSEKADYTENYKSDGTTVDTKTTYFYHITGNERAGASAANADSYMTESETRRVDATLKQVSYYEGTEP